MKGFVFFGSFDFFRRVVLQRKQNQKTFYIASVLCSDLVQRKVVPVICALWQDRDGRPGQVGSRFEHIRVSCTAYIP